MFNFVKNLFDENAIRLRAYWKTVNQINLLESEIQKLSDKELSAKTNYFKAGKFGELEHH